jgi:hypothetical protein
VAEHVIGTDLYYDAGWNDLPVYHRDGIAMSRGAGGEGQDSPPSSLTMTVDNRTRDYTPSNRLGTLAGKIGRNTPVRLVVDGATRTTVEASSWAPDQAMGPDADAWVELECGGILRRLQQGKTPLYAPLHRAVLADSPAAFWPMTDGSSSNQFASGLVGGDPIAVLGDVELGAVAGVLGAAGSSFPDLSGGPTGGPVAMPALTASAWGFEALVYLELEDESITDDVNIALANWNANGDVGRDGWTLGVGFQDGFYYVTVLGNGFASSVGFGVGAFELSRGWHHVRLQAEQVGGNVEITLWVDGSIPDDSFDLGEDVAVGTLGAPKPVMIAGEGGLADVNDVAVAGVAALGMLAFYSGTVPDHADAAAGFLGELAGVRFLRVLAEEGVPAVVIGDELDTQPMGAQPPDTLLGIVRECIRTDDGMLFEPADTIALAMRTGRSRYNQAAGASFSFTDPGLASVRPKFDDRPTFNDVTVQRRDGGTARAVQTHGPMNVQDPIDDPEGVGRVDTKVDVNTESDDVLPIHAGWHLSKGTVPDPRYPQITIDLDDAPGLTADVHALDIGDRFELTDLPTDWALEAVSLLLVGIRESLPASAGHHRRLVTLVTAPAAPFEILLVGDGTIDLRGMRVHTTSSTVDGAHVAADTTILIDSAGVEWTTNADNWNPALNGGGMFLELAGELVRVTGIAGAGSAWTLTVVRAVNGVSQTIPDGTPVRFRYPGRIAL